jgi:hypothetical protein
LATYNKIFEINRCVVGLAISTRDLFFVVIDLLLVSCST